MTNVKCIENREQLTRCEAGWYEAVLPWKGITPGGRGVLPYMGYIGMCRCEGYGFQAAVYSRIGYINQSVWI